MQPPREQGVRGLLRKSFASSAGGSLPDGSHEGRGGEVWRLGPWGLGWTGGQGWGALGPVLTPWTDSLDRAPP